MSQTTLFKQHVSILHTGKEEKKIFMFGTYSSVNLVLLHFDCFEFPQGTVLSCLVLASLHMPLYCPVCTITPNSQEII